MSSYFAHCARGYELQWKYLYIFQFLLFTNLLIDIHKI